MSAVSSVARARLRRGVQASILLVGLVAIAVALALAAIAGARRTDRVIPALMAADAGADGYLAFTPTAFGGTAEPGLEREQAQVRQLPGVVRVGRFANPAVQIETPSLPGGRREVQGWMGMDRNGLGMVSALPLVRGRRADDSRATEIVIDEELGRDAGIDVGSSVRVRTYRADQLGAPAGEAPAGEPVTVTVVGVTRRPTDLRDPKGRQLVADDHATHPNVYLTSALWRRLGGDVATANPIVGFRTAPGTDTTAILDRAEADLGAYPLDPRRFLEIDGTFVGVERSASVHARGLVAFAVLVALTGLFLVGQTLGRQVALEGEDQGQLLALGMTERQLRHAALLRSAPVAGFGAAAGVVGAVALSPLTPLPGTVARRADLHPGVSVDPLVLLGGGALAALLILAVAAVPAIRQSRPDRPSARRRPVIGPVARATSRALPAPESVGISFALERGRGSRAVPVRTAMGSAIVAVVLLVATTTFVRSLDGVRHDPLSYGVTWDVASGAVSDVDDYRAKAAAIRRLPGVEEVSGLGNTALVTSFGEVPTVMVRREEGSVVPRITSGRAPGPGEVALGAVTLREQGLRVGDELEIRDPVAGRGRFLITGTVILNTAGIDPSIEPGRGALFDWSILDRLRPGASEHIAPSIFVVRARPGEQAEVERRLRRIFPTSTRSRPVEPLDLANLGDASLLPTMLGVLAAVLGVGTVAHAMISAVRRRGGDLAILAAIGLDRSELRRSVATQAVVFGGVALLVGIPLGLAVGRVAWRATADQLGVAAGPTSGAVAVGLAALGFLGAVLLAALVPAQLASRLPVARRLRQD